MRFCSSNFGEESQQALLQALEGSEVSSSKFKRSRKTLEVFQPLISIEYRVTTRSRWNKGREMHKRLGPCGFTDGTNWDDGCHQRIESIFVCYDSSSSIRSIQTVYKDFSDNIFRAPQHGPSAYVPSVHSYHFEAVHLPPETPITQIDGYYDQHGITCLELSTNNGKICSFGTKTGSPCFIYKDPRGFTGFHGCSSEFRLKALGVYAGADPP